MVTFRDASGFALDVVRIPNTSDYRVCAMTPDAGTGVWVDVPAYVLVGIGHALSLLHPEAAVHGDPVDRVVVPPQQRPHNVSAFPHGDGVGMTHVCHTCGYRGDAVPDLPCPGPPIVGRVEQAGCDGSGRCPASVHIHGCYSDEGNGQACDRPDQHPIRTTPVRLCRECRDGKHANCDGVAWDDTADAEAPCTCPVNTHGGA